MGLALTGPGSKSRGSVAPTRDRSGAQPIVFVMPLPTDPRINRRVTAAISRRSPASVFTFHRDSFDGSRVPDGIPVVSLGRIEHGDYWRRLTRLPRALFTLLRNRHVLRDAEVLYAFGPDCFTLCVAASLLLRLRRQRLVYELADVRDIMLSSSVVGVVLRSVERMALRSASHVVVTSSGYRDEYFAEIQRFSNRAVSVVENKLMPPLPAPRSRQEPVRNQLLRIGWFGLLRHRESWELLVRVAKQLPDTVQVDVRGHPMHLPDLEERAAAMHNIRFSGPYSSPDDLAEMYASIDVSWVVYGVGDDKQRRWMLPNRLFESVYYGVPIIATQGSLLAERVEDLGIGWGVRLNDPESVVDFVAGLSQGKLQQARKRLRELPRDYAVGQQDNERLMSSLFP